MKAFISIELEKFMSTQENRNKFGDVLANITHEERIVIYINEDLERKRKAAIDWLGERYLLHPNNAQKRVEVRKPSTLAEQVAKARKAYNSWSENRKRACRLYGGK